MNVGIYGLQRINLLQNPLEGKIPSSICQLRELQYIDLQNNSLSFSIPFGGYGDLDGRFDVWVCGYVGASGLYGGGI